MVSEDTYASLLDPTKTLSTPRSHRRKPEHNYTKPIALLLLLMIASPFLITSVLRHQGTPRKPASKPYTAETYAPHTFPAPPYVEPSEPRTADVNLDRASRAVRRQESKVEIVISFALAQQGKRYVRGMAGPDSYDCSGLVMVAFRQIGMNLYHYTGEMIKYGQRVSRAELQRGDIVFPSSGHVGIYLGDGRFLHASSDKGTVAVSAVRSFYTARRLL